jgi:mannose-6-phosphate isomerase-like protein (cupin superfamily)
VKHVRTRGAHGFFHIVAGTPRSQAATMVLRPGQSTGGEDNVHRHSDQWLFVVSGAGAAVVNGRRVALEPGSLLLIEAGEPHEIRNDAAEPLVTINVYGPPAYAPDERG